jgi:hypothetical protein
MEVIIFTGGAKVNGFFTLGTRGPPSFRPKASALEEPGACRRQDRAHIPVFFRINFWWGLDNHEMLRPYLSGTATRISLIGWR